LETIAVFSFQGAVAPDYGKRDVATLIRTLAEELNSA
jgi:hypothetical protein